MRFILLVLLVSCSSKKYCSQDLQSVAAEDQKDRKFFFDMTFERLRDLSERDEERRKSIARLVDRGCLKKSEDYKAAALVYQHGNKPQHFKKAFEWSKKSYELGDQSQKSMMAMSLDRYLVKSGHRQLFGTQASKADEKSCWCLEPIEKSFPEKTRLAYTGKTISGQKTWLKELNRGHECTQVYCQRKLTDAPKGMIPEW